MARGRPGCRGTRARVRAPAAMLVAAALALAACADESSSEENATGATLNKRSFEQAGPGRGPLRPEPRLDRSGWDTDFSIRNARLAELVDGGARRSGIRAIDDPAYVPPPAADRFLADEAPLLVVTRRGEARGYPLQILMRHEIVNDELAGQPIAVTYCPLSSSSIVFSRRLGGRELTFGATAYVRNSDLVMWDRQTESWWQHFTGEAIVGELTGTRLDSIPSQILSWEDFRARYPSGEVLSRDTGFDRDYRRNPHVGYDEPGDPPFRFSGPIDDRLPPKERVAALFRPRETVVLPFSTLREEGVVNELVGAKAVVVFFDPRVDSVLDRPVIARSGEVGTVGAFRSRAAGRELTFAQEGGAFVDLETGSRWDLTGRAVAGPLVGAQLEPLRHDSPFWFVVSEFHPEARIAG